MENKPSADVADTRPFILRISGTDHPAHHQLVCAEIAQAFNEISMAEILLRCQGSGYGPASPHGQFFVPGADIEMIVSTSPDEFVLLFSGSVISLRWEFGEGENPYLRIICKHRASRINSDEARYTVSPLSDSHLMERIISSHGLHPAVEQTQAILDHAPLVTANQWELLCSLAERNGFVIECKENDHLHVGTPMLNGQSLETITFGTPGVGFHLCIHGTDLPKGSLRALAQVLPDYPHVVDGKIFLQHHTSLKPGSIFQLLGFGAGNDGRSIVTKVIHRLENLAWKTELDFIRIQSLADQ